MKAVRIARTGGPEVMELAEVGLPEPKPGEIRVRHEAIGLNFIDVYHRTGLYPLPLPHALGMEGAGIVEAVGEGVTHLKPGDRVAYCLHWGSYAEYSCDIDYIPVTQDWKDGDHPPEDSFYQWGPNPPEDFAHNFEVAK